MSKNTGGRLGGISGSLTSLRSRLGGGRVLEFTILGLVIILAIIFRVIRIKWGAYLDGFDPYFQYRVTQYVVKNGYSAWFTWNDTLSWWPMGREIAQSSFPATPFTAAAVYTVLRLFGVNVSVLDMCIFFPALMGTLTCIVMYFIGKDLGGKSVGLMAAFFLSISEAHIARTFIGFFDNENIGLFSLALASLCFVRSIDREKGARERIAYAAVSGLSVGYLFSAWGAARYIVGLLTLFILAAVARRLYRREHLISYGLTMGVGLLIAIFVPKLGINYLTSVENVLVIFLILVLGTYEVVKDKIETGRLLTYMGALFVAMIVVLFTLQSMGIVEPITGKFWRVIDPRIGLQNALYQSVAEHRRPSWVTFYNNFGLSLILGLLATFISLTDLNDKNLYAAIFFITGVYFAGSMSRLNLLLSLPASLMAGLGLKEIVSPFMQITQMKSGGGRRRQRRLIPPVGKELAFIFILFIFVGTLPIVRSSVESSSRPTSMGTSQVGVQIQGEYPMDWLQALAWMNDNLPDDAIVVSWWDHGYWIESVANKTTLADGSTRKRGQINNIALIMMSNYTESLRILEEYNATHIVVFQVSYDPEAPYEFPGSYNGIWGRMVEIAGLNMTDYRDMSTNTYTEKFKQCTMARLMGIQPPPGFSLVYNSEYAFVLVYEIDYGAN
jgi:dolichyl-diphosphooligosaccharide--protein glycosyltransferase